jgi:hypothetical protein
MSYQIKKTSAVIQLTADVTDDLIGSEVITGTPTVSIEPSGSLTAGVVTLSSTAKIAFADFSAGIAGESYQVQFEFVTDVSRIYRKCQTVKVI